VKLRVLLTVLVIAAAALLWHALPVKTQIYAPFDVHGRIGKPLTGRGLRATVNGAGIAPTAVARPAGHPSTATGIWVVVDTTLESTDTAETAQTDLLVGPNTYTPSEQFLTGVGYLQPGIAQRRFWVFDVAPDVLESVTAVVLRIWLSDPRLDNRLLIDIPLDRAEVSRSASVDVPRTVLESA
jgi:hypothetical protein